MSKPTIYEQLETTVNETNIFASLKGGTGEHKKNIGMGHYKVRNGMVDMNLLRLEPVDAKARKGNPRLLNIHAQMLQEKPDCGPMTEEQQIYFFQTGTVSGFSSINDPTTAKEFRLLQAGLDDSGESKDPIIIQSDGTVLEGNRRTAHCKLKMAEDPETKFKQGRVQCLQPGIPRGDILLALAQEGVLKKASWDSQNKIAVLQELRDKHGFTTEQISLKIGMGIRTAQIYLRAGDLLQEYQGKTKDLRPEKFTMFYKVATNPKLGRMMLDPEHDSYDDGLWDKFCELVKADKIQDCRHVAELTSKGVNILGHPSGLKWLEEISSEQTIARVKKSHAQKNGKPAVQQIRDAVTALESIKPTQRSQLAAEEEYIKELETGLARLKALVADIRQEEDATAEAA